MAEILIEIKEIKSEIADAEVRRKSANNKLMEYLEGFSMDGLILGDDVADIVKVKGRVNWDTQYLARVLKPAQLKRAMKKGNPYQYVKVDTSEKKVKEIREAQKE